MKKSQYLKLIESLDSSRNREVVTEYNPTGEHDWPNQGWWKSKEDKAKGMTTDQLNYAQKDCHAAGRANPDNEGKYSDEGSVYARQLAANAKRAKRAKGKRAKTEGGEPSTAELKQSIVKIYKAGKYDSEKGQELVRKLRGRADKSTPRKVMVGSDAPKGK